MLTSTAYCRGNVVQALIDAHGDVNAPDVRGMTPLMLAAAAETQDEGLVRILVHAGAWRSESRGTPGDEKRRWTASQSGAASVAG